MCVEHEFRGLHDALQNMGPLPGKVGFSSRFISLATSRLYWMVMSDGALIPGILGTAPGIVR